MVFAMGATLVLAGTAPSLAAGANPPKPAGKLPIPMLSPQDAPTTTFGNRPGKTGEGALGAAPAPAVGPRAETAPPAGKEGANLAYGAFQRGYYLTAMNIALPLAEKGNAAAQTLIGEIFFRGLGVAQSMDEAAFWYKQGAQGGDPSAEFRYALMLMDGTVVKKDEAKAMELMKKAADAGIPEAEFNYAQQIVAAEAGESGLTKALPYFEKAAQAGIADAEYALSQIYANSSSATDEQRSQARYWLTRAARAGYDTAELDLGIWLIDGVGGPKDYENGFKWMQLAAENGNVMAQNRLAHLYRAGIGTKQDLVAAGTWYVISKRAGLNDQDLDDFYQGLTDEQQKEAIRGANAYRPQ
ncbi:MAG: tetratricopeptide repeat protein [Pararhizobium sp.]